jgi:hypothetical protein
MWSVAKEISAEPGFGQTACLQHGKSTASNSYFRDWVARRVASYAWDSIISRQYKLSK